MSKKLEMYLEKMKEKFCNLVKEINMRLQEAHRVPNKMDAKRPTPRHIVIKMPKVKDKERILKTSREKQLVTCKVSLVVRLSGDFLEETLQARRDWQEIFKVMKNRTYSQDCSTLERCYLE